MRRSWYRMWSSVALVGVLALFVGVTPSAGFLSGKGGHQPPPLGSIEGKKWNDLNASGTADNGDVVLNGWKVYLFHNGKHIKTATTGHHGTYSFPLLLAATYVVCEARNGATPNNWQQSAPTNNECADLKVHGVALAAGGHKVTLGAGQKRGNIDFLNFRGVQLTCGQEVSTQGNGAVGSFTPLGRPDSAECRAQKGAQLATEAGGVVVFRPHGPAQLRFRAFLTFTNVSAGDAMPATLEYDPTNGTTNNFGPMPACIKPVYDHRGLVTSAQIPNGDTWCVAGLVSHGWGHNWKEIWQVYGEGDPKFRT